MKAEMIMNCVDELIKDSCDLVKLPTFGEGQKKHELAQKCENNREKLQAFADEYEQLAESPH